MTEYNEYKFFVVFSRLNKDMNGESDKSKYMNKYKSLLIDAVRETGMVEGTPIMQRDKGIGQAGSNRTFCFDIYVTKKSILHEQSFNAEQFKKSIELYLKNNSDYDWMQVLTKDDIKMGRASKFIN